MNYIGFTKATNLINGKVITGCFVFATEQEKAREILEKNELLAGCTIIEKVVFVEIVDFSTMISPCLAGIGEAIATTANLKQAIINQSWEFSAGNIHKLKIEPFASSNAVEKKREYLKSVNGTIECLAEDKNGTIKVFYIDEQAILTKRKTVDTTKFEDVDTTSEKAKHLALCYPELKGKILPVQLFTNLNEEYSF